MRVAALAVSVVLVGAPANAQVSTDGSVGAAQDFGAGNATIPASFGTAAGGNLFHSFSQFNVNSGATVTFTGPGDFTNVVSRVTGGSASAINGTLRSEIGSQGFYLFNPAGVLFGQNASIDVPAAFHVSDAGAIFLNDGGHFSAASPGTDVLASAAPAAFGFLTAGSGGITFQNAQVVNDGAMSVSAAGGIVARNSLLLTDGADLRLQVPAAGSFFLLSDAAPVAVASAPTIDLDHSQVGALDGRLWIGGSLLFTMTTDLFAEFQQPDQSPDARAGLEIAVNRIDAFDTVFNAVATSMALSFGSADIIDSSLLNFSDQGDGKSGLTATGGILYIQGAASLASGDGSLATASASGAPGAVPGAMMIDAAELYLVNTAVGSRVEGQANIGDLDLHGDLFVIHASTVSTNSNGNADAGNTRLSAGSLFIQGGSAVSADTFGSGAGGSITAESGLTVITNFSSITAVTVGSGPGGTVGFSGDQVYVDNGGYVEVSAYSGASAGAILADVGYVEITGPNGLYAGSYGGGPGGVIDLSAETLVINTDGRVHIEAHQGSSGGRLAIDAATVLILDGGQIQAASSTGGTAADVNITAGQLAIAGTNTGIQGQANGAGAGSRMTLNVGELVIQDSGQIAVFAAGSGDGGQLTIEAGTVDLSFGGNIFSGSRGAGASGSVRIGADRLTIDGFNPFGQGSVVLGNTSASARGSDVVVNADLIQLIDGGQINVQAAGAGQAGSATLNGGTIQLLNGEIAATADGPGDGGSVTITGDDLIISGPGGRVLANVFGGGRSGLLTFDVATMTVANGGVVEAAGLQTSDGSVGIAIQANSLSVQSGSVIQTNTEGSGKAPGISITVGDLAVSGLGTAIRADTSGAGDGGSIAIVTETLAVHDHGDISSSTFAAGNGGQVSIVAQAVTLTDDGAILTFTGPASSGDGGLIHVEADTILVSGILPGGFDSGFSEFVAETQGTGAGGTIELIAGDVSVRDGGRLISTSFASGDAGNIRLTADTVTIADDFSRIIANGLGAGRSGLMEITAGALNVRDNGIISSNTAGTADARGIRISAASVALANGGLIESVSDADGRAGDIAIAADTITLSGNSLLSVEAFSTGHGGNILLQVGTLTVSDGSGIAAASHSSGDGGSITITRHPTAWPVEGDTVALTGSEITSAAFDAGDAGSVTIILDGIDLADNARIATTAAISGGGAIGISDAGFLQLAGSTISSSVFDGTDNGGNIDIQSSLIVLLPGSSITANAFRGNGGAMAIETDGLFRTLQTLISASSTFGIDGTINIAGPQNPETATVVGLPSDFLAANRLLRNPCLAALLGRSDLVTGNASQGHRLDAAPAAVFLDAIPYPSSSNAAVASERQVALGPLAGSATGGCL